MLPRLAFAIVMGMSSFVAAQPLPVPQAITDPAQLQSATVENLQKFTIPALYSTRLIGGSAWSPDGSQVDLFPTSADGTTCGRLPRAEAGRRS